MNMASDKDSSADLMELMTKMMSKMDTLSGQMTSLERRVSAVEENVEYVKLRIRDNATTTSSVVEKARQNIASLVCYNNGYNIIVYGLSPARDASLEEAFRCFMVGSLLIEPDVAGNLPLVVQLLGKSSPQEEHYPMCISFTSFKDATIVKDKLKKYHKQLKKYGVWANWVSHHGTFEMKN